MAVAALPRKSPPALVAGGVVLAAWVTVDVLAEFQVSGLFCLAAVIVAVSASTRWTIIASVAAVIAALASGLWNDNLGSTAWAARLAGCLIGCVAATLAARNMERDRHAVRQTTSLAQGLLDALAVELTGARTVKDVAKGFVGRAADRLGASSGMVFVLDGDQVMRSVVWMGRGGPEADRYTEFPIDADLPGALAARQRLARHYRDRATIESEFPRLRGYYPDDRSLHVLPLTRADAAIGLLALTFPVGVITTAEEEGLLVSLGGALSAALTRAQELEAADAAAQRTQLLAEASLSLFRTRDFDDTLAEACRLLVPRLADWCVIQQLKDGQLVAAALRHRDPSVTAWAQSMRGVFPADMEAPTGAPAVIRTGRSELYPYIPRELLDAAATSEEHAEVLHRLGMVSAVVAPLNGHDGVIGAISLIHAESGRRFTAEDVDFLEDMGRRIGLALDTAATLRKQTERLTDVTAIAEAAQLAILAPLPDRIGPLLLSAHYVSAAEAAHVGGDLYEVVPVVDRIRLLVGDVRGKGLPAVRTATVVLGEFRAAATQEASLTALAKRLDQQLRPWLDSEEDFVTACLLDIAPDGSFEAVSCGHPPPFHIAGDSWRTISVDPAPPLGLGVSPAPGRGQLSNGDRLLLYTDGLLEARTPDGGFFDPDTVQALAAHEPFDRVLDAILSHLRADTSQHLQDDLALLLVGYAPTEQPPLDRAAGRSTVAAVPSAPRSRWRGDMDGFRHEALISAWSPSLQHRVELWLREGLARGEDAVVAGTAETTARLAAALTNHTASEGTASGREHRWGQLIVVPREEFYGKPVEAIAAGLELVGERVSAGSRGIRMLGQVTPTPASAPWSETTWREWLSYEATLKDVFADLPLWSVCAYDPAGLPAGAAEAVRRAHPFLSLPPAPRSTLWRSRNNPTYTADLAVTVPWRDEPLTRAAAEVTLSDAGEVPHVRTWLRHHLRHLPQWSQRAAHGHTGPHPLEEHVAHLVLATDEVVTNGLRHGRPPVTVRVLAAQDALRVTVTDTGPGPADALAGYTPPRPSLDPDDLTVGGAGLWMARRLCDRVSFSRGPAGFTVHLTTSLEGP